MQMYYFVHCYVIVLWTHFTLWIFIVLMKGLVSKEIH